MQAKNLRGMTLIELLTTVSIIAIITTFTFPSLTAFRARQVLTVTERKVQSVLYQMHQLALAPRSNLATEDYDILGYGVYVHASEVGTFVPDLRQKCTNSTASPTDFVMLLKYVRYLKPLGSTFAAGDVVAMPTYVDPKRGCGQAFYPPETSTSDIVMFDALVKVDPTETSPAAQQTRPWVFTEALVAAGSEFGDLKTTAGIHNRITDPLSQSATAILTLKHTKVRNPDGLLRRTVQLERTSNGISLVPYKK